MSAVDGPRDGASGTRRTAGGPGVFLLLLLAAGACTFDLVDLPEPQATPPAMFIQTRLRPDEEDPDRVVVDVHAALDPGVTSSGVVRRLVSEMLGVDVTEHPPVSSAEAGFVWAITISHSSPGPRSLVLRFPEVEGVPAPSERSIVVGIGLSPADTARVGEGEDLVLLVEPHPDPPEDVSWSLSLGSASEADVYLFQNVFGQPWPAEIVVPSALLSRDAFPVEAVLQMSWRYPRTAPPPSVGLPPYEVELQSSATARVVVVHR